MTHMHAGVLAALSPCIALTLSPKLILTIPAQAHELRGSLPPPSEDGSELTSMQFTIQTSTAGSSQPQAENGARPELQQLPSGVLIQGLPAALMSCCQVQALA